MTDTIQTETTPGDANGAVVYIPLNKLKKHPLNARKKPHSEASIEAKAASIHAKGILQNLVVEPEFKASGEPTGFYLVSIGEGRRQAQLLRVKRKQIKKTEPIRCVIDTVNDPSEISLDENVNRENLHPADEYERFHELSRDKGWGAEEIGARFGRSPDFVKRRLRLGAVSPKLIEVYRQDGLTLDQLMAFTVSEDHARQEQVFESLSWNKEPALIRRDMTAGKVPGTDRRAVFIGPEAYQEAGGVVILDLFTEGSSGYFEDAGLLDTLVAERLREIAADVLAEGWKWAEASIDFPHDHGMRRYYPQTVTLSDEDEARLAEAAAEYDDLIEGYSSDDEMPEDVAAKVETLDAEIDAITVKRSAYDPDVIARGGAFVMLNANGMPRIERGFVRVEDEPKPEPEAEDGTAEDRSVKDDEQDIEDEDNAEIEDADDGKPIPDSLIRDLTAHRTLGLRLALGEQPGVAIAALTHALVLQLFAHGHDDTCLQIRTSSTDLGMDAEGIADTKAGEALAARHDRWAEQLPGDVADLWAFIVALDGDSREGLLAHCVSLTVNAVKTPWERKNRALAAADVMAEAVSLDMTANWTATKASYFGRVTKAHIAKVVNEAVSPEAAERITPMKKPDMAEAAEQLVGATGWLPAIMRTPEPEPEASAQPSEAEAPDTGAQDGDAVEVEAVEAVTDEQPSEAETQDSDASEYSAAAE
ncbi:ParB N-terminal domain-containing protein [Rhizorhabdus wittichii]|uniref:ParB N-terminal domain-containing protein n=1 Tax=Rhizorhabdus wittichii TaxID=160791 RepID=A0A975D4E5_9SPHN|nr:ParB/Srx family N-terminal domain-containing protein [Rhizorhabdus wittichii]QTH22474.1 ParB N-terminal domain-containing protein [Rhizorhabdus wittichii]